VVAPYFIDGEGMFRMDDVAVRGRRQRHENRAGFA
jgi:hypothetical protein